MVSEEETRQQWKKVLEVKKRGREEKEKRENREFGHLP